MDESNNFKKQLPLIQVKWTIGVFHERERRTYFFGRKKEETGHDKFVAKISYEVDLGFGS